MNDTKIFASIIDNGTRQQIMELERSEAYNGCTIRVMPDAHKGAGCTIGSVIAIRDRVVPETVGVDIGCAMLVIKFEKQDVNLERFDEMINERIPSGFNIHEKPVKTTRMLELLNCREAIDEDYMQRSIGTLGGGNHFIEVNVDDSGNKFLVIHSGSRNLGKKVCEYWQKKAVKYCQFKAYDEKAIIARLKAEGRQKEIAKVIAETKTGARKTDWSLSYLEGEGMKQYIHDMQICQMYAEMNRQTMADIICESMDLGMVGSFTTLHNYIDIRHNILRKGAVSALAGEELLIPMNMRDGSLYCIGKGNIDWLYSAPHGAGRLMSRRQAREQVSMDDYEAAMMNVYSTSVCPETIDESPMVYKPMDAIVECIKDTVDIVSVIKPIYNFKAKASE